MTKEEKGTLLFLGTGGSMGVPLIGCHCDVCRSHSRHNKRLRPSALCTVGDRRFLIDCGPDFKYQALRAGIETIDGVIFTHAHNDHTAGIDDLRIFCLRSEQPLSALLSSATADDIERRFYYLFERQGPYRPFIVHLDMQKLKRLRGEEIFHGVKIGYFTYEQVGMLVNGYRFGDLAYVTDIKKYPDTIFEDLKGIKTLVISALRFTQSPMHLCVDEAIEFAKRTGAEMTWLIHIAHELDHEKTNAYLPENIRLAYDGLEIDFTIDGNDDNDR